MLCHCRSWSFQIVGRWITHITMLGDQSMLAIALTTAVTLTHGATFHWKRGARRSSNESHLINENLHRFRALKSSIFNQTIVTIYTTTCKLSNVSSALSVRLLL